MGLGEFGRIEKFFKPLASGFPGALGLDDDAAVLPVEDLTGLVVSNDAVVAGVHFRPDDPADLVARKALRCNLSDMAAMGAEPWAYTLTLALSTTDDAAVGDQWVEALALGLAKDQEIFGVHLIGGDSVSTPGPTMLSITIFGKCVGGTVLRRSGARVGDDVYVSGTIGDAALGLRVLDGSLDAEENAAFLVDRYHLPRPRVVLGAALLDYATAAMDVSDGLAQDLSHICAASKVGAELRAEDVPLSPVARSLVDAGGVSIAEILGGGDDYELLFTAPKTARETVTKRSRDAAVDVSRIGEIVEGLGLTVRDGDGEVVPLDRLGYRHG
ncbi:MAG: thiamine-phosphate kinase [Alphaproteobacteria bacterium]|jgi:thiamine-monophosphate kinase|nr:thiamine-phosphate kinase [Alphaproteobacteria bacterium]